jgi:hypothetical protein
MNAPVTQTTAPATVAVMTEYPARLQMSMLAPVKKIADAIKDGDKEVRVVGYVFGTARGVSFRNNPNSTDGEAAKALIGAFEGIPSYVLEPGMSADDDVSKRARLASGVCFLPPQAQEVLVSAILASHDGGTPSNSDIKRGQRSDQLGVEVEVSLEIGIRKSGSPVGYEWVTRGLSNVVAKSPIERMRERLGTMGNPADLARIVSKNENTKMLTNQPAPEPALAKKAAAPAKGKKR